MSKKIQLTIADPCHENWDNMTQAEKGRFCNSCQKQVIDFSNMSDSQLAAFFKKPKDESVCGRFYHDQLDRSIEIPKKRIPWVKYFFQFALPAFLVSMKATAQGNVRVKLISNTRSVSNCSQLTGMVAPVERIRLTGDTTVATVPKQNELSLLLKGKPKINREPVSSLISIKGIVIDQDNNPVPFASVMIKGTTMGAMADSIGIFRIEKIQVQTEIILQVSSVGYEVKERLLNNEELTNDLQIQLSRHLTGEVVVVSSYTNYKMGGVTGAVSVVTYEKRNVLPEEKSFKPMIKIYPNPVTSGTNINIGCQKLKEGYYGVQLANQSGQQVLNRQTWIDGEIQVLNIDIPNVAAGVYFLKLTSKETNKRFTQKIIVQ